MDYQPAPWMIMPFGLLLGMIAVGPLLFATWWARHYPKVAFGLGLITLSYYCFGLPAGARQTVLHTASEYFSFIALIGSLYIVSGGIHILVKGEATPSINVAFLLVGAILSNVLGTTGASMLLIRPWLRMNKYRVTAHHVVFFIFIVSNVGGCLTPIGDPPLFLGYLKGVPFWWVAEHCWPMWAVGLIALLLTFFVIDYRNYLRAPESVRAQLAEPGDEWRFEGLANILFLGVILAAVFVTQPIFLREALMIGAALGSYFTTRKAIREANHFNFHPLQEVAILFVGIFATMMPALDWLGTHASKVGSPNAGLLYFGSGALSSLLDNAPTYLSFLTILLGSSVDPSAVKQVHTLIQNGGLDLAQAAEPVRQTYDALRIQYAGHFSPEMIDLDHIQMAYVLTNATLSKYLLAISIASVFFGAATYIGNGPNFMVKSIADHQKIHAPGFLGYIVRFTIPFLAPMLVLVWWLFFRQ